MMVETIEEIQVIEEKSRDGGEQQQQQRLGYEHDQSDWKLCASR